MDRRLLGCLAQTFDEKVGADMTGYDAAHSIIESLGADGYMIVPKQPTEAMLAAALPLAAHEPSSDDKRLGARACMLLSGSMVIPNEGDAVRAAAQLAQDYRAMIGSGPEVDFPRS